MLGLEFSFGAFEKASHSQRHAILFFVVTLVILEKVRETSKQAIVVVSTTKTTTAVTTGWSVAMGVSADFERE